jgi:hypothetical protein
MASPAARQHPFWDLVPLEVLALIASALVLLLLPLSFADEALNARLLRWSGKNAAPAGVLVVSVRAREVQGSECAGRVLSALRQGGARAALVLPPLDDLCELTSDRPPVTPLPLEVVHRDRDGRVLGFEASESAALSRAGVPATRWVAPRPFRSVPSVAFSDLGDRGAFGELLRDRLIVLTLHTSSARAPDEAVGPLALEVGGALGAALSDRPREEAPRFVVFLLGAALLGLIAVRRRKPSLRWVPAWLVTAYAAAIPLIGVAGVFGIGYLLPLPSLGAVTLLFLGITELPAALAARRARARASHLLGEVTQVASRTNHLLSDAEFFTRLAHRVEQTHAADGVLIAELPPFNWRLTIWPNGDLNESIIKERRRDVRRTPYVDEAGARRARIVDGYLVMVGVPVVFAPLEAAGELEGYVLLIGKPAAHAFVEKPHATEKLATELAHLVRARRLEKMRADDWRRPAGMLVENPAKWSEALLEKAQTTAEDLELYSELFRLAPVGLLYADPFGDVRMLGEQFRKRLQGFGVALREPEAGGFLPPNSLPLATVLQTLANRAQRPVPTLSDVTAEGVDFEIELEAEEQALKASVLRVESRGQVVGFLATLVTMERSSAGSRGELVQRMPERGDPLSVFSLSEVVADCVDAIARDAQIKLRFQTPRAAGHVIAHQRELTQALTAFLLDVARSQTATGGPVVTLRERGQWVELTLIDLRLGVPEAAMQRTVLAPSVPPPGLEPLARFVRAAEESHGQVRIRGEQSWGVKLTVSLLRARPRVQPSALGQIIRISESPGARKK